MLPVGIDVGMATKNREHRMKTFFITLAAVVAGCLLVIAFWGPQGLQMPTANEVEAMTGQPVGPPSGRKRCSAEGDASPLGGPVSETFPSTSPATGMWRASLPLRIF